jgi:hypothetical protein
LRLSISGQPGVVGLLVRSFKTGMDHRLLLAHGLFLHVTRVDVIDLEAKARCTDDAYLLGRQGWKRRVYDIISNVLQLSATDV